jgi:hypothetical protein
MIGRVRESIGHGAWCLVLGACSWGAWGAWGAAWGASEKKKKKEFFFFFFFLVRPSSVDFFFGKVKSERNWSQ